MRLLVIFFCLTAFTSLAQVPEVPASTTEQQLENITENNEDVETEDDSYLQELREYLRNPLNLNEATEAELKEFRMLSPIQINNFLVYRSMLGNLISFYELQAVPGWDPELIRRLQPYVTVRSPLSIQDDLLTRFSGGDHSLMIRMTQVLERSRGFTADPAQSTAYMGSPQRLMLRYKYNYKNLLQYGIVGEKDPGEEFFKGSQKQGFDFYSAHLFARNMGVVKALALGDFTVNLGQGLIQWQSMAFRKGPDVLATKRQATVLRPYNSAGEIYFHRGAGITVGKSKGLKGWEATVFGSIRNIDANFASDTAVYEEDFVTSFQISGYHRTPSEIADKGIQRQLAFGGNASYKFSGFKVGVNSINFKFKYPVQRASQPYNRFAFNGDRLSNQSIDYSYTYKNLHFFGEAATSSEGGNAFVNGLLVSASPVVDISLLYRHIDPDFQSLYGNAFTESTLPVNEKGFFAGLSIKPDSRFRIDAYADFYRFPYLRSRVNRPSEGSDYFVQLHYRPNRQMEVYTRYKRESKAINFNPWEEVLSPVIHQPRQNWRTQFSLQLNPELTARGRVDLVWFDRKGDAAEEGALVFTDLLYRPALKPYSFNGRILFFDTDGYNSRLYTYENDVLYSFSIPVFYGKGVRYYLNASYDITRKLRGWVRIAQTVYRDRDAIGSGLDEIKDKRRTELKLQLMYTF